MPVNTIDWGDGTSLEWQAGETIDWGTVVPPNWDELADWLHSEIFITAMRAEANGPGVWAYWSPGAIHGTAELNLNMAVIKAHANGAAVWARWAPGAPKGSGTLQLDAAAAVNANFT